MVLAETIKPMPVIQIPKKENDDKDNGDDFDNNMVHYRTLLGGRERKEKLILYESRGFPTARTKDNENTSYTWDRKDSLRVEP